MLFRSVAVRALALPLRRLAAAFGAGVEGFGFGHGKLFINRQFRRLVKLSGNRGSHKLDSRLRGNDGEQWVVGAGHDIAIFLDTHLMQKQHTCAGIPVQLDRKVLGKKGKVAVSGKYRHVFANRHRTNQKIGVRALNTVQSASIEKYGSRFVVSRLNGQIREHRKLIAYPVELRLFADA